MVDIIFQNVTKVRGRGLVKGEIYQVFTGQEKAQNDQNKSVELPDWSHTVHEHVNSHLNQRFKSTNKCQRSVV